MFFGFFAHSDLPASSAFFQTGRRRDFTMPPLILYGAESRLGEWRDCRATFAMYLLFLFVWRQDSVLHPPIPENQDCGIKGFIPTSVIQENLLPLYGRLVFQKPFLCITVAVSHRPAGNLWTLGRRLPPAREQDRGVPDRSRSSGFRDDGRGWKWA